MRSHHKNKASKRRKMESSGLLTFYPHPTAGAFDAPEESRLLQMWFKTQLSLHGVILTVPQKVQILPLMVAPNISQSFFLWDLSTLSIIRGLIFTLEEMTPNYATSTQALFLFDLAEVPLAPADPTFFVDSWYFCTPESFQEDSPLHSTFQTSSAHGTWYEPYLSKIHSPRICDSYKTLQYSCEK